METAFKILMIATFTAAVVTLLIGVGGMGRSVDSKRKSQRSNKLMAARVGLCALLLCEMLIFAIFIQP